MARKKAARGFYSPKTLEIMKIKLLLLGVTVGLLIGGLAIFIVNYMNTSHIMQETANYHPATFGVAEKFLCGCPDCEMELVKCNCTRSSGGTYEMYYISEKLKEGYSEEQVIREAYEKFGNIKERYQHLTDG